jgi:hypothetical protein
MVKYDSKTLLPLLVVVFHFLNPTIDGLTKTTLIDDDFIFGVVISNATTLHGCELWIIIPQVVKL